MVNARRSPGSRRDCARAQAVAGRYTAVAARALSAPVMAADVSIHRARKALKHARAALRLLRGAAGKARYARENANLRDAARAVGHLRDARVMLEAVTTLLGGDDGMRFRRVLLKLRRILREERLAARGEMRRNGQLRHLVAVIESARHRIVGWSLARSDPSAPRTGLARMHRHGRRALKAAADGSDENLHQLRKQAKYLAHALKIVCPPEIPAADCTVLIKHAEVVADCLGDDHNFAVLNARVAALRGGPAHEHRALRDHIVRRRRQLQRRALRHARSLYHDGIARLMERNR